MFYSEVNGIIFVIDGSDYSRLIIVKELINTLEKDLETETPIVFLINKQDLEQSLNKTQIKQFLNIDKLDTKFIYSLENSIAYSGFGVKEALSFIINKSKMTKSKI